MYQAEDGQVKLEVRLQNETVWLTQQMIAELFQTTVPNISMHIRSIYAEGELTPEATIKKFLTVRREGNRDVRRELDYYNLDMIISVGYRVKSLIATRFRIWATQYLREYIAMSIQHVNAINNRLSLRAPRGMWGPSASK